MTEPQLGLFEGLALLVGEPAKKRRERRAAEDAEGAAWCEKERRRVLAEARAAELAAVEPCMLGHDPAYICPACADCGDTDGCGFLHRQVCKGRIPLRACRGCGKLKTHGTWNHADWFHCLECVPLGTKKDQRGA